LHTGLSFSLHLQLGRNRQRAKYLLWAIVLSATLYAAYGLIIYFTGAGIILWVSKTAYLQDVTGTFVNRNSFATYIGLGLLCACGLYLSGFFKALQSRSTGRIKAYNVLQHSLVRGSPLLACILILATTLFLTNSRAGVVSSLAALLVFVSLMGWSYRVIIPGSKVVIISLIVIFLGVLTLSGDTWLERFSSADQDRETRMAIYDQTWQATQKAPWTGYGIGGYENTFPMFAHTNAGGWRKAHNDWLETMFDLGVPASLVWFGVLGGLAARCIIGFFRRERDQIYSGIAFSACILVGLHAVFDFSMQIPAVAVLFAAITGLGVTQSWSSHNSVYESS
jgi:O-antigen ligase